jgi:hypothetical protein
MNPLVESLYRKAWAETTDHHATMQRFAELIVRECANLFEVEWGEEKLTGNDVGYVVKKHFGVER